MSKNVETLIKSVADMENYASDLISKSENLKANEVSEQEKGSEETEKKDSDDDDEDVKKSVDVPKQTGEPNMSEETAKKDADEANGDLSDAAEKSGEKPLSKGDEAEELGAFDPKANEDISKAIEISDFLSAMTGEITEYVNGLGDSISKSLDSNNVIMGAFAKSFQAIASSQQSVIEATSQMSGLVKSMANKMDEMSARIEEMEGTPTMRKSVKDVNVINKDFSKSVGTEGQEVVLSKSEKASILTDLIIKGEASTLDMLNLESGASLDPSIEAKIQKRASNK